MSRLTAMWLDCASCDGYLATQANDEAAKDPAAARWRMEYGNPNVDVAYVTCDGCRPPVAWASAWSATFASAV